MKLFLDTETFCELGIDDVGTYRYAEEAVVTVFAYSIDGAEPKVWDRANDPVAPADLVAAMINCDEAYAHNAQFDRVILNGKQQADLPNIPLSKWRCTMAQAASHALPMSLEELGEVLGIPSDEAKLKEGKKLINLFCKPQPANRKIKYPTKATHPEEWAKFLEYAGQDVKAMVACYNLLPKWNWNNSAIAEWHLNQVICDRGFAVDRELTKAAAAGAITEKARIGDRFRELTKGAVDRPSLRAQFLAYLNSTFGLDLPDTTVATFNDLLSNGVSDPVLAELLDLAMRSNKSSTAKYAKLDGITQSDGVCRGGLQFCGAGRTRRDAGRGFQPQNLPSRGLPKQEETEKFISDIKAGTHDFTNSKTMQLASAALRGCVVPRKDNQLLVSDLANIEGRLVAFLSNEEWKIQAFKDFDAGTGADLYNLTAVSIVGGDPFDLPKSIRNSFGKVPELALGYMGGVSGIQQFAKAYGVTFEAHWETIQERVAPKHVERAKENLTKKWAKEQIKTLDVTDIEWVASETVKLAWREKHPNVVATWYALDGAFKQSLLCPNVKIPVGEFINIRSGIFNGNVWTQVILPSGRALCYLAPKNENGSLSYLGNTSEEGKTAKVWSRIYTHGGKLLGNICQSVARDILYLGLKKAEEQGYNPVLSVHDEIITDAPKHLCIEGLTSLMAEVPDWLQGMPLAAAGFSADRYKKD